MQVFAKKKIKCTKKIKIDNMLIYVKYLVLQFKEIIKTSNSRNTNWNKYILFGLQTKLTGKGWALNLAQYINIKHIVKIRLKTIACLEVDDNLFPYYPKFC